MHPSEEVNEEELDDNVNILHCKIFEKFEQIYLNKVPIEQYYDDEEKEKKRRVFLKNAMHVHNKAIFDCLNELLDRERLFGLWGEPFVWKKAPKFRHTRDGKTKNVPPPPLRTRFSGARSGRSNTGPTCAGSWWTRRSATSRTTPT